MTSIITHEIEERYPLPRQRRAPRHSDEARSVFGVAEGVQGWGDEESHGS